MKHLALAAALVASVALGAEFLRGTLSGTGTQTLVVGPGSTRLAIQCTTPVRYRLSNGAASTVTSNDALVATGDPYIVDKTPGYDRINIAHQDTTTAISCSVFVRIP